MNICMIAYSYYRTDHRIINYAGALAERGYRVDFIGLKRPEETGRYQQINGVNVYGIQNRKHSEQNLLSYLLKMMFFFIKGSIFLCLRHLRYDYSVIHIHNVPDWLVFMAWVPKLGGAKVILDIHDILPELYCQKFNKTRQSYIAKFALLIEKLSVACADHVIVANDLWQDKLQIRTREAPKKFTTILNYPREELLARAGLKSPTKYFTIIYPGTISHHHGVDIAIKAMPLVIKKIPRARFHIYGLAGNINYYHHLKSLINRLELNEYVKLFDQVQHKKLLKIYETMSVGVVPKREGIFSSEAFSTKIFDFMAVGLPVVVSRTKIDLYYFDSSMVRYFEPGNHQDLARCIIELYQNSDRRNSMVQKAMQFIGDNNWTVKKDIYYRIIDQLCGSISKHAI